MKSDLSQYSQHSQHSQHSQRLTQQIQFILEIDKLKHVLRRSHLIDHQRLENTAEHSWHLALMALVLTEHAREPVQICKTIKMLLLHDVVEIDAGDTYCYDEAAHGDKMERENRAADRIFGLLPVEQATTLRDLWEEFENGSTPEAQFARALDRLMPLLHNYHTQGKSWKLHGVTRAQVRHRNREIGEVSEELWQLVQALIDDAVAQGYLGE